MPITDAEWASVHTLVEKKVADKGEPFTTDKVIKRDPDQRVVWTKDFGDEPIPIVDFQNSIRSFDTTPSGIAIRTLEGHAIVPQIGDTVLIARELGTRRLPRCLGVIGSNGLVPSENAKDVAPSAGGSGIPNVAALPANPVDGQEVYYFANSSVFWHLRYRAAITKWDFLGGPPLFSEVATAQATTTFAWQDLATIGPQLTNPLAGDYIVAEGCEVSGQIDGAYVWGIGLKIGASTPAYDMRGSGMYSATLTGFHNLSRTRQLTDLAASTLLKLQYQSATRHGVYASRFLSLLPVKVWLT